MGAQTNYPTQIRHDSYIYKLLFSTKKFNIFQIRKFSIFLDLLQDS